MNVVIGAPFLEMVVVTQESVVILSLWELARGAKAMRNVGAREVLHSGGSNGKSVVGKLL